MKKLTLLEQYYEKWKASQRELHSLLLNLEGKILEFDERLSKLEEENKELIKILKEKELEDYYENIWIKIREYAINAKTSSLLNPSRNYWFHIVEVAENFIRVDKLGNKRLTKNMFITVFEMLKEIEDWIKIGASVKNTKPETVEGCLKLRFFGGNMDGQMTAPWVSAILVRSDVGVRFNNKAIGQAIRYLESNV